MTQQSQANTEVAAAPVSPADLPTLQQRVEVLHEQIRNESATAEPAGGDATAAPPTEAPSPADSAAAKEAPADPAAARAQRLEALKKNERDRLERTTRLAEQEKIAKDLEAANKRAAEAEARASKLVDLDSLDEASFFRLAQQKGIAPSKLAEFIRESMANPERVAEAAALDATRKAMDPEIKALKDELAALKKRDADREAAYQAQLHQQQEARAAQEFFSFTKDNAPASPYAAAFLERHGGDEFYKLALQAAQQVPPGAGWQPILDVIEENLSSLAPIYAPAPTTKANGKGQAPPPNRSAAAKATTVTNSLAQERASVVEESDWSDLPFEERVARMKR